MAGRNFVVGEGGLPNIPGMMFVTVEALRQLGGSGKVPEIVEKVNEIEGVTEEEQFFTMPNNKTPRVNYYLAWARTYLRNGDAAANTARAFWELTEAGRSITTMQEVTAIYNRVNREQRGNSPDKGRPRRPKEVEQIDPEDWKSSLLAVLKSMLPDAFERLSQRLLREAGFTKVSVQGKTGDGGIDGVGVLRVNLVSFQIYFQCKRWNGSVGSKEIREFRGALQGGADKGLFITTGHFTKQASDEATRTGAIAIDLIDGDRLCDLLKQYELGVETEMIERIEIQSDWFDSI